MLNKEGSSYSGSSHDAVADTGVLKAHPPLFTGILPEDYRKILASARMKQYARGEMLYVAGDPVRQVVLLTGGSMKITQIGPGGAEVIIRLSVAGDVLGTLGLFSTGRHCTTAETFRACRALVWEARDFKNLVDRYPLLHQNMVRVISGYLLELEERFREVATERVEPRVARQIVRLRAQLGQPGNGAVDIGLSREELAQMTGTTLFTVSRLLSDWHARGMVKPRREGLTICDFQSLRELSEQL
jgi:CRP-like cAMP-binding protein